MAHVDMALCYLGIQISSEKLEIPRGSRTNSYFIKAQVNGLSNEPI